MNPARRCSLLVLLATFGCWRAAPEPKPFSAVRTAPDLRNGQPVLLNDTLTVYFSAPLLPLSVTTESVTVVDSAGNQVPGGLRVGSNWVTFVPDPPLTRELDDGSFRPGGIYHLHVAGCPRPDAVRSLDGRRLSSPEVFEVRVADHGGQPPGLPAPLRPPSTDLPFLLRVPEILQQLPADAPRLRLHFTLPLLPPTVVPAAFEIRRLPDLEAIVPRSVRVVTSRLDEFPGSTVEIDIGAMPRHRTSGETVQLRAGDYLSVVVGRDTLRDYSGAALLSNAAQWWTVIDGTRVALIEWPAGPDSYVADDPLLPGFEVHAGAIRGRVRTEAGDGSLGVFRPQRDTTLRPGQAFDRGDGEIVVSRGSDFPFLAIDIAPEVTVTIDATASPARLLAAGGVRIAGELQLRGGTAPMPSRRLHYPPVRELVDAATVALVASGRILVSGRVVSTAAAVGELGSPLLMATAERFSLRGAELPLHTLLAIDSAVDDPAANAASRPGDSLIEGARGQSIVIPATFTYGAPPGAELTLRGWTPWRQMPLDRDGGVLELVDRQGELQVAWQSAPADTYRPGTPDLAAGRRSRVQLAQHEAAIAVAAGSFIRFELSGRIEGARLPPRLRELRLVDR